MAGTFPVVVSAPVQARFALPRMKAAVGASTRLEKDEPVHPVAETVIASCTFLSSRGNRRS